jgi:hypothetical protein
MMVVLQRTALGCAAELTFLIEIKMFLSNFGNTARWKIMTIIFLVVFLYNSPLSKNLDFSEMLRV